MDKETVTLISAVIAAIASVVALLLKIGADRNTELRGVKRKALEAYIVDLGQALHEVVASSNTLLQPAKEKQRPKWIERAKNAQKTLKGLRPRVRYSLWGAEDAIRSLSYLPDWAARRSANLNNTRDLIEKATALRVELDVVIRNCYDDGRVPWLRERLLLKYRNYRFLKAWGKTKDAFYEESDDAGE